MMGKAIPKQKDWYWEAEQDKIAADEDLKLIRTPEDWPSEGLDCVGLWFLMMNLMARSQRRGYLLSPADTRKPMSDDELAVLTGRSSAAVSRLKHVLLLRGLFSQNEEGIIYSRGLVRKEEIRKIRSKSGKKGGLRTQVLLKQNVKQNVKQTLGIGVGILDPPVFENLTDSDFAKAKVEAKPDVAGELVEPSARLAFLYRSCLRGRRPEPDGVIVEAFSEMLAMGASEQAIASDLQRKPPERDRSEHLWEIRKRVLGANGRHNSDGKPQKSLTELLREQGIQ